MKPVIYDFDILREEGENENKDAGAKNEKQKPATTKQNTNAKQQKTNATGGDDTGGLDLGGDDKGGGDDPLGGGGSGNDDDLLGGGSDEPDYTLTDIGKTYILEKVYESLNDLLIYCNFLYRESSKKEIEKIRNDIFQAKELFVLLSSNIDKYMDKLDSIINEYRKFVSTVSKILYNYSKEIKKK